MKHLCYLLFCFFLLSSCSVIKKTFRKTKGSKSEQVHSKSDSTGTSKADSTHVIKSDSTGVTKIEDKKENWWQIDIDTTQPSTVEITIDSAGKQTVKATGKIKSISGKSSQIVNRKDSVSKAITDSLRASTSQTAKVSTSDKKTSHETLKQSGKDVDKTRVLPGLVWVGIVAAIAAAIYFAKKYRIL